MARFFVFEDIEGGLTLIVLDDQSQPVWCSAGFELDMEVLRNSMYYLEQWGYTVGWVNNDEELCSKETSELLATDWKRRMIAAGQTGKGIEYYPERMGSMGQNAFSEEYDGYLNSQERATRRRAWREDEGDPRNPQAFDNPEWNGDPNEY